ncbi:MAG: GNAT family N-acetyltransferase [Proteobacteria bacterium]|nr:GNAT family N-acetyltransferase [Pseudomonadota bacterium]
MTALRRMVGEVPKSAYPVLPADVVVRPAVAGDADPLSRLLNQLVRESSFLGPEPDEQGHRPDRLAAHLEQNLSGGRGLILGGFRSRRLVGYVEACRGGFRANAHVLSVQGVGVLAEHQGLGIGQAMLAALLGWARRHEVRRIALSVREDNVRAEALYRRIGFEREGTLRDQSRAAGVFRAEHVMALILKDD